MDLSDENAEDSSTRSQIRSVLTEIPAEQVYITTPNILNSSEPPVTSPDELIIVQRGRRRKPAVWSPINYKTDVFGPSRDKTPEKLPQKCEISSKLRKRLILSPDQTSSKELNHVLCIKLKSLPRYKNRQTV